MKTIIILLFSLQLLLPSIIKSQFHDYSFKYGFKGSFLIPRTEFDNDSYTLSLIGKGFLKTEINDILEVEIGTGIGQINGKDFVNDRWSTDLYPLDLFLLLSPFYYEKTSPYIYSGITLLRWKISNKPKSVSPFTTNELGWDFSVPTGVGLEMMLNEETLLDIRAGYNFTLTDQLNFYKTENTNDGYFNIGIGLTFVVGGGFTDEDNDGLKKNYEISIGTNPFLSDTDGDKIIDGEEVNVYYTDPLSTDSDSDSLNDYQEIMILKSDPNSVDTDGDNIPDHAEVNKFGTSLLNKDSDSDDISDNYEIYKYKTNPTKMDTDDDNLTDNDEIKKYNTDPNNKDTDGDGINDDIEILVDNTDPLDPNSVKELELDDKVLYLDKPLIFEGIVFETNSTSLKPESVGALNEILNLLNGDKSLNIEIRGYTDNVGNYNYNKELSLKRADEVKLWLVKRGIDALRITTFGYGEMNPIADNDTPEGRKKNRRIEFYRGN